MLTTSVKLPPNLDAEEAFTSRYPEPSWCGSVSGEFIACAMNI